MKKIKIMILLLIIVIILLISLLLVIPNNSLGDNSTYGNNEDKYVEEESSHITENYIEEASMNNGEEEVIVDANVKEVTNSTKFYTISNCIQKYFDNILIRNKVEVYSMLNNDYINSKGITEENIFNYVHDVNVSCNFTPLGMNFLEGMKTEVYSVYGKVLEKDKSGIGKDVFFIVNLCNQNLTFSITPLIEKNYTNIQQINIKNEDIEIERNNYNIFTYYRITDEELIRKYISNYKLNAIYNTKQSYYILDKEYREKRFKDISEYEKYVKDNIDTISNSILKTYKVSEENGIVCYDYIDQNGNHYIFKETAIMQYTMYLDDYTILTEEEKQEYRDLDKIDKARYNLIKFVKMMNSRDYSGIYNVLDNNFKENNYKEIENLKAYIKENAYEYNNINVEDYNDETYEYIIFNCSLINLNNEEESKALTVVINLLENEEFTMSFSFN